MGGERMGVELLTTVSLEPEDAVLCRCPGCGRRIYADVHVLRLDGAVTVYGSACYRKLFGAEGREAMYPWKGDGKLTDGERLLLEQNTEAFIAQYLQRETTPVGPFDGAGTGGPSADRLGVVQGDNEHGRVGHQHGRAGIDAVQAEYIAKAKDGLRRRAGFDPDQHGWVGLVALIAADMQFGKEVDWSWIPFDLSKPNGRKKKPADAGVVRQALTDMFDVLDGGCK